MALGLGIWGFVWTPAVSTIQQQDAKIIEQREVLGRLLSAESLAGDASALEQKSKSLDIGRLTLKGESDPLRTAELQTALTKIVAALGLRLKSTRALPARDAEGVRLIGIQAQFQATLAQLQKILLAIDANEPILVIEALRVVAAAGAPDPKTEAPAGHQYRRVRRNRLRERIAPMATQQPPALGHFYAISASSVPIAALATLNWQIWTTPKDIRPIALESTAQTGRAPDSGATAQSARERGRRNFTETLARPIFRADRKPFIAEVTPPPPSSKKQSQCRRLRHPCNRRRD